MYVYAITYGEDNEYELANGTVSDFEDLVQFMEIVLHRYPDIIKPRMVIHGIPGMSKVDVILSDHNLNMLKDHVAKIKEAVDTTTKLLWE